MNSSNLLARNARKYPQVEAIVSMGKRTTYSELNKLVNQFADALLEKGVFPGEKVVIFMPNVLEFVISYFAVQRIGAIVVPINAKFTLNEVEFVMNHSNAKGVLFTYRNILTVAHMIAVEMEVKPESRLLLMMPLSHSAPLHLFLMAAFVVGSTSVLTPTFTPDLLIDTVVNEKTTHFFGAPVAYLLTASNPRIAQADLSSMQWWVYGGAPLSKQEVLYLSDKFRTDRLVCVYGLTEAGPSGSILHAHEHPHKAGSIGKRAPLGTELRIVNEGNIDVPQGEIGEIVLRGEGNMKGYYKNEQATKAAFINGWLRTGDLARQDEDGYLWIIDRKKDMIISGGINIYPKEIEETILAFSGITEVAVIGVPHAEWGETVKAVFAGSETVDIAELTSFLSSHLANFKIPKLYEQVDALPRNASGKILKHALKEQGAMSQ